MNPYTDITSNNHGGNKQSMAANIKVAPVKLKWKDKILGLMALRGQQGKGTTCREAANHFGKESGHLSPRFTELKIAGVIEETGVVENGFMAYRLAGSPQASVITEKVKMRAVVTGPGLRGEILLEKTTGGWQIGHISPDVATLIGKTPISEIGGFLRARGYAYVWGD